MTTVEQLDRQKQIKVVLKEFLKENEIRDCADGLAGKGACCQA